MCSTSLRSWVRWGLGVEAPTSPTPNLLLSVAMWELEQGSRVRPTSVNADPCDPGTVEQTQSEITQCSIKGWGLKVSFVLIGSRPSSLPRWLSRLFCTCNMDWEDEYFLSEWVATCFARSCHCQHENSRSGGALKRNGGSPARNASFWIWLKKLKVHVVHVVACGFQPFPMKSRTLPTETIW